MGAAETAVAKSRLVARASAPANGTTIFLFILFLSISPALAQGEKPLRTRDCWAIRSSGPELNPRQGEYFAPKRRPWRKKASRRDERDQIAAIAREPPGDFQLEQKRADFRRRALHGADEIVDIDRRGAEQRHELGAPVLRRLRHRAIRAPRGG